MNFSPIFFCVLLVLSKHVRSADDSDSTVALFDKFGTNDQINLTQTGNLFDSIGISSWKDTTGKTCSSSQYFHKVYSGNDGVLNKTDFIDMCPELLYQLSKKECERTLRVTNEKKDEGTESPAKAWGFGFLFVTIISCGSLFGAATVPLKRKFNFEIVLMVMISLAVGVLSGSGIFHLIPHALKLGHKDLSYLWKCAMVVCGLYIFFILDSTMQMILYFKEKEENNVKSKIVVVNCANDSCQGNNTTRKIHVHSHLNETTDLPAKKDEAEAKEKKKIAPVAWMIIIGDGLHNFIDGLAIGVSCSTSVVSGLSTSIAILCEELPHELGDFAILLNSGMTLKQAMCANFLSACTCYIGLVVGLVVGYKTAAVHYVYGIAGGMFLYIALVNMLPEALQMVRCLSGNSKWMAFKMSVMQHFSTIFGFAAMLVLANYAHKIKKYSW